MDEMMGNGRADRDRHFRQQLAEALEKNPEPVDLAEMERRERAFAEIKAFRQAEIEKLQQTEQYERCGKTPKEEMPEEFKRLLAGCLPTPCSMRGPEGSTVHHHHEVNITINPDPGPKTTAEIIRIIEEELKKRPPGQERGGADD